MSESQNFDSLRASDSSRRASNVARETARRIEHCDPSEAADMLTDTAAGESADVAEILDPGTAGRVLAEMHPQVAATVVARVDASRASMVLGAMNPDDRVDVLQRIPRDPTTRMAVAATNLYPTGEGAGYAGGIISAAIDGIRTADALPRTARNFGALTSLWGPSLAGTDLGGSIQHRGGNQRAV